MRHTDWEQQRERLSAYLDGALTTQERDALAAHLRDCDDCQRELAALRQTRALLSALPTPTLPRSFLLPDAPAVTPIRRRGAPVWARPTQTLGGIAAMIGLGLLVTTALPQLGRESSSAGASLAPSTASHTYGGASSGASADATKSVTYTDNGSISQSAGVLTPAPTPSEATTATTAPSGAHTTQAQPSPQPFPVAPVAGGVLLIGGAAAVTAGELARRRARHASQDESADEPAS